MGFLRNITLSSRWFSLVSLCPELALLGTQKEAETSLSHSAERKAEPGVWGMGVRLAQRANRAGHLSRDLPESCNVWQDHPSSEFLMVFLSQIQAERQDWVSEL